MKFINKLSTFIQGLENLAFPRLCASCGNFLFTNENAICTKCLISLPFSFLYDERSNYLEKMFWGRVPLEFATAHYVFKKGNKTQHLLHSIKYDNRKDAAILVGKLIAIELNKTDYFKDVDFIMPVPLHPVKLAKRGYNQSALISNGISQFSGKATLDNCLVRTMNTATQTKKNKYQRWENVEFVFAIKNPEQLINKHVLLIDDVITTGATIESCAQKLIEIEGVKVSIAAVAVAKKY